MAPQFKLFPQQIKLRVAIRYRAGRPGAELQRPHLARPRQNADRRPDGQFVTWHGGDGGSQDGIAHDPELSLIAAAALPAGDFTRAVKRLAAHAPRGPLHVRLHRRRCTATRMSAPGFRRDPRLYRFHAPLLFRMRRGQVRGLLRDVGMGLEAGGRSMVFRQEGDAVIDHVVGEAPAVGINTIENAYQR